MNNVLYQSLQKWTPFSVCTTLVILFSCVVVGWFVFHNQTPPIWSVTVLSVFGTIMAGIGAVNHGVVVANGVAGNTARAVVKEMQNASSDGKTP